MGQRHNRWYCDLEIQDGRNTAGPRLSDPRKTDVVGEEPFKTAYEYFEKCLRGAKLCVVIGFSFRDPAVNDRIAMALNANAALKLVIVEPGMDDSSGVHFQDVLKKLGLGGEVWDDRVHVIKGKFGEDGFVLTAIDDVVQNYSKWDAFETHWVDERSAALGRTRV